jgi:acyl-CoA thioesterase-2
MASVPTEPDDAPHERAARGQLPGSVDQLLAMLDLERLDRDLYRAPVTDRREEGRLFGGMVAAQALRAATLTVDTDHHVHSLHGYFLRPGKPRAPLLLHVDRIRDGRSFTTRRVVARQDGEAIFSLSSSFHKDEPDGEYATPIPAGVPDPDDDVEWYASPIRNIEGFSPLELRNFAPTPPDERGHIESTRRVWLRTRGDLPHDRALHACVLTFVSDMGAVLAAAIAVGGSFGSVMGASLDHAVWFHRPIRMDEWVLFDLRPLSNAGSRGLVIGSFHSRDGVHGASVAQEALVRHLR